MQEKGGGLEGEGRKNDSTAHGHDCEDASAGKLRESTSEESDLTLHLKTSII
jgi:hypothetical protein